MENKTLQETLKENQIRRRKFIEECIRENKKQQRKEKIIVSMATGLIIAMLIIIMGLCCREQIMTIKNEQMEVIVYE